MDADTADPGVLATAVVTLLLDPGVRTSAGFDAKKDGFGLNGVLTEPPPPPPPPPLPLPA